MCNQNPAWPVGFLQQLLNKDLEMFRYMFLSSAEGYILKDVETIQLIKMRHD